MTHNVPELFDRDAFTNKLAQSSNKIPHYKHAIKSAQATLFSLFDENVSIELLIKARSHFIDTLMIHAWRSFFISDTNEDIALIAVGGYGRAELHPYSDVDILILLKHDNVETYKDSLECFITFLWDIGIEIGSSVRTLQQCIEESAKDITIATNIVESRLITGPESLFQLLDISTGPDKIWPSPQFFKQKWLEQIQRHSKYHNTAYNLEPNIKEGPGGLRDLQMIGWVTKRHFGDNNLKDLVHRGFLTETEYADLQTSQSFLWKIRFALHKIAGRREDRLLFEHQRTIAS
ncbi:MAG: nucleotidyltransferase domain-containing protein, partial [Gammaproteobacteria bacterium]|nr:nucleotidyltransferase domain-containing protein [Gammaproteobacteria bacterium]